MFSRCLYSNPLLLWKGEAQNEIASAAPSFAATRRNRDELFAAHHVHGRRREHASAGIELPQQFARLRVVREEVPGNIATRADKHESAGSHHGAGLAIAFEDLPPRQLAGGGIVSGEVALRRTSCIGWAVDGRHIEQ